MIGKYLIPYFLIVFGFVIFFLGIPKIRINTIGRLQQQNILPIIKLKPKQREIILEAGPDLSLMIAGTFIIVISVILLINV